MGCDIINEVRASFTLKTDRLIVNHLCIDATVHLGASCFNIPTDETRAVIIGWHKTRRTGYAKRNAGAFYTIFNFLFAKITMPTT